MKQGVETEPCANSQGWCWPSAAVDGNVKGRHSHRTREGHGLPGRWQLNTQDRPIVAPCGASASWFWARIKALRACNGTGPEGDALAYQAFSRNAVAAVMRYAEAVRGRDWSDLIFRYRPRARQASP